LWVVIGMCSGARADDKSDEAAVNQYARQLEAAIATGKIKLFNRAIDDEAFFKRMMGPLPSDRKTRLGIVGKNRRASTELTKRLLNNKGSGATTRLLRVVKIDGVWAARFRVIRRASPVPEYYRLVLDSPKAGRFVVVDMHPDDSTVPLSVQVRRPLLPLWMFNNPKWKDKLDATDRAYVRYASRLELMFKDAAAGRYQSAASLCSNLPKPLDGDRDLMRYGAHWALQRHEEDAKAAMEGVKAYLKKFGNDVGIFRSLLDKTLETKQWQAAMGAVDRIDEMIGGDAYLDVIRGQIEAARDQPDKATAHYAKAVKALPKLPEAYYAAINHTLKRKAYGETVELMIAAESKAGVRFGELKKSERFEGFIKSKEFELWQKRESGANG